MRTLKLATGILAIAFVTLTTTSCKESKKEHNNEDGHHTEMKSEDHNNDSGNQAEMRHDNSDGHHDEADSSTDEKRDIAANTQKNAATTPIVDAYLEIKNALVADNKSDAAKGGTALLAAFSKFDMSKLEGETHKEYMEIYESAKEQAEHIVKSPIDHQREHFETLSLDVNDLITLLGTEKTLYQDFCPMANGGKGAIWLSEFKDIKNPFYGSKMMTCGKMQKQIN